MTSLLTGRMALTLSCPLPGQACPGFWVSAQPSSLTLSGGIHHSLRGSLGVRYKMALVQDVHCVLVYEKPSHNLYAEYSGRHDCLTAATLFRSHVAADSLRTGRVHRDKEEVTAPPAAEDIGQTVLLSPSPDLTCREGEQLGPNGGTERWNRRQRNPFPQPSHHLCHVSLNTFTS